MNSNTEKPTARIVVVDVETTGLKPERHGIIEIGAVDLTTGLEFFAECRIPVLCEWEQEALDVNGATPSRCYDPAYQREIEAVIQFSAWLEQSCGIVKEVAVLAGMNPRYDLQMILGAIGRAEEEVVLPFRH